MEGSIRIENLSVSDGGDVIATLGEPLRCTHCDHTSSDFGVIIPQTPEPFLAGIPYQRDYRPDPGE